MASQITFHADLLDTDLQDFDAHWWGKLKFPSGGFMPFTPRRYVVFYSIEVIFGEENEFVPPVHPRRSVFTDEDYDNALEEMDDVGHDAHVVMTKKIVFPAAIHYISTVFETRDISPKSSTQDASHIARLGENHFELYAFRYRRDRLKLIVHESDPQRYGGRAFWTWLQPRWGDAIVELAAKDAVIPIREFLPPSPPVPNADGYSWDDVFDWWYRGGRVMGYPTLKSLETSISRVGGTIKNQHSVYVAEYGEQAMPDYKSRFAGMSVIVTNSHDNV